VLRKAERDAEKLRQMTSKTNGQTSLNDATEEIHLGPGPKRPITQGAGVVVLLVARSRFRQGGTRDRLPPARGAEQRSRT
jgi:hypothetical protein